MKRMLDLFISIFMCLLLGVPFLCLIVLVRLCIGVPVFFQQQRPGKDEKIFIIYKLRTMNNAKDASGKLLPDAERLTRFGKFLRKTSLDELPQLWNVLKGEMSLVGPRALLVDYLPLYSERQKKRHNVKPGITGWAQVNGRNAIRWEEKFELDVWYVEHQSIWLDIKILWLTAIKVFKRHGISQEGQATMERFRGAPSRR